MVLTNRPPPYVVLSPTIKVAYMVSPKNASGTVRVLLGKIEGLPIPDDPTSNKYFMKNGLVCSPHSLPALPEDYKKFTVVRNPFDRVVSFFTHKIRNIRSPPNKPFSLERPFNKDILYGHYNITKREAKNISFDDFVDRLFEINPRDFDNHLSTQWDNLRIDKLDTLIRFEKFDEEFQEEILSRYHDQLEIPVIHKSKERGYRSWYSDESRKKVRRIYEKDLEKLNYEF